MSNVLMLYKDSDCMMEHKTNIYDDFIITRENIPKTIERLDLTCYLKNTSTHSVFNVNIELVSSNYSSVVIETIPDEIQSGEVMPLIIKPTRGDLAVGRKDIKLKLTYDSIVNSDRKDFNTVERLKVPVKYIKVLEMSKIESSYTSTNIYIKDVYDNSKIKNTVKVRI